MTNPTFEQLVDSMTMEVWHNMRKAVELGRWPDGRRVSDEQRQLCMQAVIAWEIKNLPEEQRSGYLPDPDCDSYTDPEQPVFLQPARAPHDHGEQ